MLVVHDIHGVIWQYQYAVIFKKEMATGSCILVWISHRQKRLEGYSPWGHKELDMT